jgi:hypothetical protein
MTNTAVKEKVRVNDTEFEITLKPVLPQTENDPMRFWSACPPSSGCRAGKTAHSRR